MAPATMNQPSFCVAEAGLGVPQPGVVRCRAAGCAARGVRPLGPSEAMVAIARNKVI